jgi:hypothetical protein
MVGGEYVMSMDNYVRRQVMMCNLELNLKNLYHKRDLILEELNRVYKQIEKHVSFLIELEKDEDDG